MSEMMEQIKSMLTAGVDSQKLIGSIASRFYETVEDQRKSARILTLMLAEYDSLEDYFEAANEKLSLEEEEILKSLEEDMEYDLQEAFDRVEDDVKHELLKGKPAKAVLTDLKKQSIVPAPSSDRSARLSEDELEEIYLEAFEQFDFLRLNLWKHILSQSPKEFYEYGESQVAAYRKEHGLLMDAREFNAYYSDTFDKERLWNLLSQKIYDSIHYNRRYILEEPAEEDDDEEAEILTEEQREEEYEASQKDAVLVGAGDMSPEDFTFVYELMAEYTGRRVLPSENEYGNEAYWMTYGDDFAEVLGLFMIAQLENTIRYFNQERAKEYGTLADFYHWSQEQRENPEVILSTCDKISYYLSDLQESLWNEFTEAYLQPLYEKGKALAEKP